MNRLKVTLVVPNFKWANWDVNTLWHYIPYNLCLLAAMVEDLCDVTILDANQSDMTEADFKNAIKEQAPDVVGITVLMDQYAFAGHKIATLTKSVNKDVCVVMGGVYATMNPEEVIKDNNIDYVVIGEGEYVFRDMVQYFSGNGDLPKKGLCYRSGGEIINTGHSDFVKDLDKIPLPAYHLIDFEKYANSAHRKSVDSPEVYPYARILTSRGCPIGCVFCQVESIMGKKFRVRSAENVLDEIQFLKDRYNIKSFIIDDDNLFIDKKRSKAFFQGLIDRNLVMPWLPIAVAVFMLDEETLILMRKSGCTYIDIAIESGSQRVLKEVIKKPVKFDYAKEMIKIAQREGIYVAANFVIGFPTETWEEIRETIKFAEDSGIDYMKLFVAIPLKNTRLWDLCIEEDAFKKGYSENEKKWSTGQIETEHFSADDLTILRAYEWERINFSDPQKRKRTAQRMGMTEMELLEIRRKTLGDALKTIKKEK